MQVDEAVEGGAMNWYLSGGFLRARIFSKIDEHVPLAIEAYEALLHYTKELKLTIFEARTRIYQPAPAPHALWASLWSSPSRWLAGRTRCGSRSRWWGF